jgi:uncharacterized damage-inducible protein DinB
MRLLETYEYLVRARRDLWKTLRATPGELLSGDRIGGPRFHSIKDLVFHIADVEDGWINGDIRRAGLVQNSYPTLRTAGPDFSGFDLDILLNYWEAVEHQSLAYLSSLSESDLASVVPVEDWPDKRFTLDGLLNHVLIHEMRHTAQIALLLRRQGVKPPSLDLLFYLP